MTASDCSGRPVVLVTGGNGQLAWELQRQPEAREFTIHALAKKRLDILDINAVSDIFETLKPQIVINTAAYTSVDKAESEPDLVFGINGIGAGNIAAASHRHGARLIHLSTDFVFDGTKSTPYLPQDEPNPINIYGESKFEGEKQVMEKTEGKANIVRTSWVYSIHGHNFVKSMLRLMREHDKLSVVYDQVGGPTWANGLAQLIWQMCKKQYVPGIWHWSDAGVASWYDFAVAIMEESLSLNMLKRPIQVYSVRSQEYQTPAKRPGFSVLDKTSTWRSFELDVVHWRVALRSMLQEMDAA